MNRPPLANLFAFYHPDPTILEDVAMDLQTSGGFAEVWHPASRWVAAAAPLPDGRPDDETVREHGLAFAEGRDILLERTGMEARELWRQVCDLADHEPHRLGSLPGDFGFVRFGKSGRVMIVRSCGGLVPFYLWESGSGRAVATRLTDLVRYFPGEPVLDPLVTALWASQSPCFPDGRTFLKDVTIVSRGTYVLIAPGAPTQARRYWDPQPRELAASTPERRREHAERLRGILLETLARDLDPNEGNLLTLSGGVDSSSLAALAAGVLGRRIWTWSLLSDFDMEREHQLSYINPLLQHLGVERRWSVLGGKETLELCQAAPPVAFPVLHPALCSLPAIQRVAPVRVLFGGEFADEVCGSAFTFPDWLQHTSAWEVLTGLSRLPTGPRDILRWMKHRVWHGSLGSFLRMHHEVPHPFAKTLPDFIHPEVRQEY